LEPDCYYAYCGISTESISALPPPQCNKNCSLK
jgi:hypothetical protein